MKKKTMRRWAAVTALTLTLSLLAGCGGDGAETSEPPSPSPEQSQAAAPSQSVEPSQAPSEPEPSETPEASESPEPADTPEPSDTPEPTEEPVPVSVPDPAPEPTQSVPEDGNYTANVTLSGGTGRATVQSPAALRCVNGQFTATIVWSSPNYDYMKMNGVRYDLVSAPGENSAFEIPVAAFDTSLPVIADTVAMSEPHEIEYTLTFDSASLTKQ